MLYNKSYYKDISYMSKFQAAQLLTLTLFKGSTPWGRRGYLMVSVLLSGSSGPDSSPGRVHCLELLGKTLY